MYYKTARVRKETGRSARFSARPLTAREQLEEAQSRSSKGHGAISELTAVLSSISKELDNVRRAKDEHEGSISDTSPLVKIKKAIAQIQEEIRKARESVQGLAAVKQVERQYTVGSRQAVQHCGRGR